MVVKIGQVLKGRKGTYQLVEALKSSEVFKALPTVATDSSDFVVVKTEQDPGRISLRREFRNYTLPNVQSFPYIRRQLDIIGPMSGSNISGSEEIPCMVFEWMDHDLRSVPAIKYRANSDLSNIVAKSMLEALVAIDEYKAIHCDINPNNIFLSNIDGKSPVVKVGDLEQMINQGYDKTRLQSLTTRAPEVWRGLGCWHSSDVWSVGVTLADWLLPPAIFGAGDTVVEDLTEAWCIAKIQGLVGKIGPPIENEDFQLDFAVAVHLDGTYLDPDTKVESQYIKIGTLRQELQKPKDPKVSSDLIDFIEFLLVVDHNKRPTALEALKYSYLHSIL